MTGTRGPVPKRTTERRRRNKPDQAVSTSAAGLPVAQPEADEDWHPIAKRYWAAFGQSGQSAFFQPSDWAVAYDLMDDLTRYKLGDKRSAMMRTSIDATLARLMATEGDRRRMRVELERMDVADPEAEAASAAVGDYLALVKS